MKVFLKALMVLFLIGAALVAIGIVGIIIFGYITRPTFEVRNTSQITWEQCEFRWRDEVHTITTFAPGEVQVFRVDSEGSMDIACTVDDGQKTVRGEVGYFTTGSSIHYAITVNNDVIEVSAHVSH